MVNLINFRTNNDFSIQRSLLDDPSLEVPHFDIDGVSYKNDYIPFYSAWINKGIYDKKIIHYSLPEIDAISRHSYSTYNELYRMLEIVSFPRRFQTKSMDTPIYGMKGVLFEINSLGQPIIHFLLAVNSEEVFSLDTTATTPEYSKFAMFVSSDFITSEKFKHLYKKLNREVIVPLQEQRVDTIITNDIHKWCYKNDFNLPSFKTVAEMKEYLETFNSKDYL